MSNPTKKKEISLTIDTKDAEGHYSNVAIITHSPTEFILDFAQILPGTDDQTVIRSRVLMHPVHVKRLLMALSENVEKYENVFGEIREISPNAPSNTPFDMLPQGEA